MALGATPSSILADVTRRGGMLAVTGVALGLLVTVAGSRLVVGLLYGISANDPATLAAISTLLLGVTVVASLIPARRAATLQPMEALRSE